MPPRALVYDIAERHRLRVPGVHPRTVRAACAQQRGTCDRNKRDERAACRHERYSSAAVASETPSHASGARRTSSISQRSKAASFTPTGLPLGRTK